MYWKCHINNLRLNFFKETNKTLTFPNLISLKTSSMHEKDRVKKLKGFPKNKSLMTLFSKHRFSIGLFDRNKDARGF